ncbi:regulator of G-protein signaling 13-like isoform 1-T1 [Synchiropus picturatus]
MRLLLRTEPERRLVMEQEDGRRNSSKGRSFIRRLQCLSSSSSATESSLTLEDTQGWSQSLDKLLESKYGLATFRSFLKSEYSDENLEFWLTCEDYKRIRSSFRQSSRAKKIYEQFVKAESPREVTGAGALPCWRVQALWSLQINIDYHTREQIRRSVKTPSVHCFQEAQRTVYALMERDSYPRFLRSHIYRTLLENLSADAAKG